MLEQKWISVKMLGKLLIRFAIILTLCGHLYSTEKLNESQTWKPVKRTTAKIALSESGEFKLEGNSWKLDFYRNSAYKCGLSGHYTFMVIEPKNKPGIEAPLWVFFHGGAVGFYGKNGKYITMKGQNQNTWNHEETFKKLKNTISNKRSIRNGKLTDITLHRRLKEGYRVLIVSYGDHDLYSGIGTAYANNPKGGEVNGLQASMAAVEFTAKKYPTTFVYAHGTSAGSYGAYTLAFAFAQEGINLNGVVMDSGIFTPRLKPIMNTFSGKGKFPMGRGFNYEGSQEKIGVMLDPNKPFNPESAVENDFRAAPMLVICGERDPFYGGDFAPLPQAKEAGLSNCAWMFDALLRAVKKQKNSPHQVVIAKNWGHTPSEKIGNGSHNMIDDFIEKSKSFNKTYPFKKK